MTNDEMVLKIVRDSKYKNSIIENMHKYGGSFVKSLSECASRADKFNLTRLVVAFPNYFEEYAPEKWENE
jgi:uncharacterized protein (DUF1330 family)